MSDWGKVLLAFLQGKPAMILLIGVAIIAFVPFECLKQVKQEYAIWVTLAGVLSVSSVCVNILFWVKDYLCSSQAKKKEEDVATMVIWRKFVRLHPDMQMFLICLFFSRRLSTTVRYEDPVIATLREQGFLTVINDGAVTMNATGELVITVMISQQMLDFMESHSAEFQKQAERIKSAGSGLGHS